MRELSDQDLMAQIGRRRQKALSELYDRYASLVYAFAWKSLHDEPAARDIVQAVFLRLWTTEAGFDPDRGRFTSWLLTVTRNITTDYLRKQRREQAGLEPIG
jgi:RNA polymerase sigma factor (sigma-70 family)